MNSRHLVDPALLQGLESFPPMVLDETTLAGVRQGFEAMIADNPPALPDGVVRTLRTIPGGDGQPMAVVIHRPRQAQGRLGCILHIHGGGYVMGSPALSEAAIIGLVEALQCVVVSVDYRLAPETRHPGPLRDCHAAFCWVAAEAQALGIDPALIAVRGESAGGGLAGALALYCRDMGGPAPCHQNLIYPMLDDRTGSAGDPDPNPVAGEFCWTAQANRFGWSALLGREAGGGDVPAHAAPARANDLSGLPSAYIAVGALDIFIDEDMAYARRLARAGVPVELHVYPGAYHGFDVAVDAPVTQAMHATAIAALARALAG